VIRKALLALAGVVGLALLAVYVAGAGWFGRHEGPGEIRGERRPDAVDAGRAEAQQTAARAVGAPEGRQILFGDLHVHTTVSFDAFLTSLPLLSEGSHPQADACDFARYCSALDFWSLNDHAGSITPRAWRESAEAIRQCNRVGGDPENPDTVAFLGWEWTQAGTTPENHYGHKNVVLAHTDEDRIPPRPVAAPEIFRLSRELAPRRLVRGLGALLSRRRRIHDFARYYEERTRLTRCEPRADSASLPEDCIFVAETPGDLFRQLDLWGHESIVIPHGTTWGWYTPPGSEWKHQISTAMHDPDRQTLFEIYSGHGNSEEYRSWRGAEYDAAAKAVCPEPSRDYLPRCWRAGEIVRARCGEAGEDAAECEARAERARSHAAAAGVQAHITIAGYDPMEWLDAGQCRDCTQPAFNYRPGNSAQYVTAVRRFQEDAGPSPRGRAPATRR
jgi:hypothetical protein